jgi:hypothetical protein
MGAGIRESLTAYVDAHDSLRLLHGRFMEIRQAMGTTRDRSAETVGLLRAFVEEHDAEANWKSGEQTGRWVIRESAQCPGETVIQVLAGPAG